MTRTDELRKIAEAATPGPWTSEASTPYDGYECFFLCAGNRRITHIDGPQNDQQIANAAFIATFNPAVVLELLDTIKTLREALEPFAKCAEGLWESGHCGGASPKDFPDKWDVYLHFGPDFYRPQEFNKFTVGDLRRAHAALTSAGEKT